ncbi:MAG TPA: PRC-barrel domain-containing protein [Xanthobacteraceae bacterium]|jgi:sporulation protein YlmC with PRC-barrel domain
MKRLPILALGAGLIVATGSAMAATELMTSVPSNSVTVTDWYKQNVYDPQNTKIGEVMDVLVSPDGKVNSVIVGVGGFLGAGEKDVAVDFSAIKRTTKDNSIYLTMNTTKNALQSAPGFKYDKDTTTWVRDNAKRNNASQ